MKNVLNNFNDNDVLAILGEGDREFDIKCIWNSDMEQEMTGRDVGVDVCFIRVD